MHIPRGAEREYITALGACAIYTAVLPGIGPLLGTSRDLHLSLVGMRRRWCGTEIVDAQWLADKFLARLVRDQAYTEVGERTKDSLREAIKIAADFHHATLTSHERVMARVAVGVAMVENGLKQAHEAGELNWFNSAFRDWRIRAKGLGRTMSYSEARARLRRAVIMNGLSHQNLDIKNIFPPIPG